MDTGDISGGVHLDIFSGHSSKCIFFFPSVVYTNGGILYTLLCSLFCSLILRMMSWKSFRFNV